MSQHVLEHMIATLGHPIYSAMYSIWQRWRLTYAGGDDFVDAYLEKLSARESDADFKTRKKITYVPAFAKAAVDEVRNAVFQRLADVSRVGGSSSYQSAVRGENGGIDLLGATMTSFIGRIVLPELLSMAKVGVFVDMPPVDGSETLLDVKRPYAYIYRAEDIKNWIYDEGPRQGEFRALLLLDSTYTFDPVTGFPTSVVQVERHLWIADDGFVHVKINSVDQSESVERILPIRRIPFVLFTLDHSLLEDASSYQIALLNMASADVSYAMRANFPFYTEQYDARLQSPHVRSGLPSTGDKTGTAANAADGRTEEVSVGVSRGRRWPAGLERPGFINPSPDPLRVSMEKQQVMKSELRQLVHLAVTNLDPKLASAESKEMDNRGLENGLSAIGLELEHGERELASIWTAYESTDPPAVRYPLVWSLQSDEDRRRDADALTKQLAVVPSRTYQREVAKQVAVRLIGHKITNEQLLRVFEEIDAAPASTADPKTIVADVEKGLVSAHTASLVRGYPPGEVKQAQEEQARRLAIIALSQSQGMGAARGGSASAEKELSRDHTMDAVVDRTVRGDGK